MTRCSRDHSSPGCPFQNGMPPNNTRLWLVRLGATPEGQPLLDAGITANLKESVKVELVSVTPGMQAQLSVLPHLIPSCLS